jgi:CDP-diacylglycerol--serine O-phosphatidyltransferase
MQKNLPNYITLLNLFCGFLGIICCLAGELTYAGLLVFAGAFFDLFDGLAARALKVHSPIGKQLDSLADCVTFGLLPAVIMHILLLKTNADWLNIIYIFNIPTLSLIPFAIAAGGAWRLAKFNVDETQSKTFRGVPIPTNGMFFASIPLMLNQRPFVVDLELLDLSTLLNEAYAPFLLIALSILFCWLMLSDIRLFSLKLDKNTKGIKLIYAFLAISVLLFVFLLWAAVPIIIFLYLILSLLIKPGNEVQSAD